jgi:hypothetical protein
MNSTALISLDNVIVDLCDAALVHMNATTFVAGDNVAMKDGVRRAREMNAVCGGDRLAHRAIHRPCGLGEPVIHCSQG